MGKFENLNEDKARAAKQAFEQATRALAAVKGAQQPTARMSYEEAIKNAILTAVQSGVTEPDALAKAAYEAISTPSKWLGPDKTSR
jgi:hypothetical protein